MVQLTADQRTALRAARIPAVAALFGAVIALVGAFGTQYLSGRDARVASHAEAVSTACSGTVEAVTSYLSVLNQVYFLSHYGDQPKTVLAPLLDPAERTLLPAVYAHLASTKFATDADVTKIVTDLHNAVADLSSEALDDLYRSPATVPQGRFDLDSFKRHFDGINDLLVTFTERCRQDARGR